MQTILKALINVTLSLLTWYKNTEDYTDIINAHDTNDIIIIWHWHLDEEPVNFMFKQLADPNINYSKFVARYNNFETERALEYLD